VTATTEKVGVTIYVIHADKPHGPEDPILFDCKICGRDIEAAETDSHAARAHRSHTIRVFNTEHGYNTWVEEQKTRERIKNWTPN